MLANLPKLLIPNNPNGVVFLTSLIALAVVNPYLGVFVFLFTAVILQARENYGVLEAGGIPVVKPTLFRGSEPNFHKTVLHLEDIERFRKFGGIWGSYVGRNPEVYVVDPELIRLVFVKDFVHFGDRPEVDQGSPMLNEVLDYLARDKWKQLRSFLTPLFTTAKLKKMSRVIAESSSEFMTDLKSECDGNGRVKIDCKKRLSTWLIDMFAQTTLGIRMEDGKNPENKFARALREVMGEEFECNLLTSLSLSFPFLARFAPTLNNEEPAKLIEHTLRQVIESQRLSGGKSGNEFLDLLCDLWGRVPLKEFQNLGITETTIIAQAINFFLGGYETSSSTLSHLLLFLADHPDVQKKMHLELEEALARRHNSGGDRDDGALEIDHELVKDSEIPYIVACINETLRLAPSLHRPERICTKDWEHKGISIKKGTVVMLASWAANRNPQLFPDEPHAFKPERFLPEAKAILDSYALTSFGFGPRSCIGMRFAYENLKLFACYLVKNFRVERRPDTRMDYKPGSVLIIGFRPVYLDLVLRE